MIGQENLLKKFNSLSELPQALLIIGDKGSGKHLVCNYISEKYNLQILDISKNINQEYLDAILINAIPTLYLIDASIISEKQLNALLKTIEEPTSSCYFVLIAESLSQVIPTIINRCEVYYMDKYTLDELLVFSNQDSSIAMMFNTPGKIITALKYDISDLKKLSDNIIKNIKHASWGNILAISNKVSYKSDESDLISVDLFVDILYNTMIINDVSVPVLKSILDFRHDLKIKNIDKQKLFENYLYRLKLLL